MVTKSENGVRTPYVSFTSGQTLWILRLRFAALRMTVVGLLTLQSLFSVATGTTNHENGGRGDSRIAIREVGRGLFQVKEE